MKKLNYIFRKTLTTLFILLSMRQKTIICITLTQLMRGEITVSIPYNRTIHFYRVHVQNL